MKYFLKLPSWFSSNALIFNDNNEVIYSIKIRSYRFKTGITVFDSFKQELTRTEKKPLSLLPEYQVFIKENKIGQIKKIFNFPVSFDYKANLDNQDYFFKFVKGYGYKIFKNKKEIATLELTSKEVLPFVDYFIEYFKKEKLYPVFIDDKENQAMIIAFLMTAFYRNVIPYYGHTI